MFLLHLLCVDLDTQVKWNKPVCTCMHDLCTAANLPSLFHNGSLPREVEGLGVVFQTAFEKHNMRILLNDMTASDPSAYLRVSVAAENSSPNSSAFLLVTEHLDVLATGLPKI